MLIDSLVQGVLNLVVKKGEVSREDITMWGKSSNTLNAAAQMGSLHGRWHYGNNCSYLHKTSSYDNIDTCPAGGLL